MCRPNCSFSQDITGKNSLKIFFFLFFHTLLHICSKETFIFLLIFSYNYLGMFLTMEFCTEYAQY